MQTCGLLVLALVAGATALVDPIDLQTLNPAMWPMKYPKCGGTRQSPIDIRARHLTRRRLRPLSFVGHRRLTPLTEMSLINNGQYVQVDYMEPRPSITVPSLGNYKLSNMHFHWGSNDTIGSEHTVNGRYFPMELHMVHYRQDLEELSLASEYRNGILVIAFLFEISPYDNTRLTAVTRYFNEVKTPVSSIGIPPFTVNDLLPLRRDFLRDYVLYGGSLTTPPCSESVIFVIAKQTIKISKRQLASFRTLDNPRGRRLVDNIRPPQPINGRRVWSTV